MPELELGDGVVNQKSKEYFAKIKRLRDMQKELLPLYLETQNIVRRHKQCLLAIQKERQEIPA